MRIIITRPAEDAENMAATLSGMGHEAEVLPLLEIVPRPLPASLTEGATALIVTSRNALRSLASSGALATACRLPVYCVGEGTAAAARKLGFTDVRAGSGTASELAAVIKQSAETRVGTLLYLTGDHLSFDLERVLTAEGLAVKRLIAYESRDISTSAADNFVEKLRAGVGGIVLMSPRTASIFARVYSAATGADVPVKLTCYCLSDAVAKPVRQIAGLTVRVARRPVEGDLLALLR